MRAEPLLGVHRQAFVEPGRNRQVADAAMRHLVNDHRLDGTQVFRLEGGEVAAARIEMHAAARRELALGVVVGDVAVVAVLVVEDDQDVLAPLRRLRHAVEHADDPLQGLAHEAECGAGDVRRQGREQQGGIALADDIARPEGRTHVRHPGPLQPRPHAAAGARIGNALQPGRRRGPVDDRQAAGRGQMGADREGRGAMAVTSAGGGDGSTAVAGSRSAGLPAGSRERSSFSIAPAIPSLRRTGNAAPRTPRGAARRRHAARPAPSSARPRRSARAMARSATRRSRRDRGP